MDGRHTYWVGLMHSMRSVGQEHIVTEYWKPVKKVSLDADAARERSTSFRNDVVIILGCCLWNERCGITL